jgi:hypothetical protein
MKPCNEILRHIHDNGEKENIEKYLYLNNIIILMLKQCRFNQAADNQLIKTENNKALQ